MLRDGFQGHQYSHMFRESKERPISWSEFGAHAMITASMNLACAWGAVLCKFVVSLQAFAVWQLYNFVTSSMSNGRRCLRINIDETSIPIHQANARGNICVNKRLAASLSQPVSKAKRRKCMTYVAVVCDDATLQPLMPQFLVGNAHTLLQKDMPSILEHMPANVILLRKKSAWVDKSLMVDILKELRRVLQPHMDMIQAILLWDAAAPHMARSVIRAAFKFGFFPMTIPPSSTGFLQPLDTHVFLKFKLRLQRESHAACISRGSGDVNIGAFLQCLVAAIQNVVLCGSWAVAFEENGFGCLQTRVSERVRDTIAAHSRLAVSCDRPSLDVIANCFPRRFALTEAIVFGRAPSPRAPVVRRRTPSVAELPSAPLGRTRSETLLLRRDARCVLPVAAFKVDKLS